MLKFAICTHARPRSSRLGVKKNLFSRKKGLFFTFFTQIQSCLGILSDKILPQNHTKFMFRGVVFFFFFSSKMKNPH